MLITLDSPDITHRKCRKTFKNSLITPKMRFLFFQTSHASILPLIINKHRYMSVLLRQHPPQHTHKEIIAFWKQEN